MDGRVVVFLRTSSVARVPLYRHLRSLGLTLVVVHPYLPLPKFNGVFHHWLQRETDDVDAVQTALAAFLGPLHLSPDAVVSFDEYAVYQAAALAERLRLTPVPLPAADLQQNNLKDAFRRFCGQHGVSAPKSVPLVVSSQLPSRGEMANLAGDEAAADVAFQEVRRALTAAIAAQLAAADIAYPVVLKPSPGAGSLLARLCATLEEAVAHVWRMWAALANHPDTKHFVALANGAPAGPLADGGATAVRILAEEYVGGQEVDIDCVVEHGVVRFCAISDNFAPSPPYFVEVGGLCPSALDPEGQRALRNLLASYVAAHGARLHGVLHFEAKYDTARRRAVVIEVNCRPGSAETHTMLHTVYREINLGESLVRCALGLPVLDQLARLYPDVVRQPQGDVAAASATAAGDGATTAAALPAAMWALLGGPSRGFFLPQCWAASVNLYPTRAGVLRKVSVPVTDGSLVAFSVSAGAGDAVAPPPVRFYLLCWMVARGKTAAEATKSIRRLTDAFEQDVGEPDPVHHAA